MPKGEEKARKKRGKTIMGTTKMNEGAEHLRKLQVL